MVLILAIDVICCVWLTVLAVRHGFEETLPTAMFLLMLFPGESQLEIPGLFIITTQRMIVLLLLGLYLVLSRSHRDGEPLNKLPIAGLIALQIIWMSVATVNSTVFTVSLKSTLSQILDYFLLFYLVSKTVHKTETVQKIVMGFVSAMILLSFLSILEARFGWSPVSLFPPAPHRFNVLGDVIDRTDRVRATFDHPILFGGALAMAIPGALYLLSISKKRMATVGLWLGIVMMFYAIYKTSSRGPWLALAMSCVLLMLFGGKYFRRYLLAIGAVASLALLIRPGVLSSLENMYEETRNPASVMGESYQWRYMLYHLASTELSKSPARALWGYGPESFYYLHLTADFFQDGEIRTVKVESCDSSIVGLMIETGYLGFFIAALVLLAPAVISFRCYLRADEQTKPLLVLFLCNMLAYYFLMTNVAIYGWGQQSYMLWTVLAMASVYPTIMKKELAKEKPGKAEQLSQPPLRIWGTPTISPSSFGTEPHVPDTGANWTSKFSHH